MNEKIVISVNYTAEDFARAAWYMRKRTALGKYAYLLALISVSAGMLFVYISNSEKNPNVLSRPEGFLVFVIPIVILISTFYFKNRKRYSGFMKRQFEKQIKSSPALQQEKTFIFDEEGIMGHSGLGSGETNWNAFIEAAESEDNFFFFTAKKYAQFVPKRAFENETQQNQLRELVRRHLGEKAKI